MLRFEKKCLLFGFLVIPILMAIKLWTSWLKSCKHWNLLNHFSKIKVCSVIEKKCYGNTFNFRHDQRLVQKLNKIPVNTRTLSHPHKDGASAAEIPVEPLPTKQFGVSLSFIKEHNNMDVIPPIVRQCVEFLSQPDGQSFVSLIPPFLTPKIFYSYLQYC